jgi:hypothetical protein
MIKLRTLFKSQCVSGLNESDKAFKFTIQNFLIDNFHTNSKPIILKIYTVTWVKFYFNEISGTQAMRGKEDLAKLQSYLI